MPFSSLPARLGRIGGFETRPTPVDQPWQKRWGTVEHFAEQVRADDANHRRERRIEVEKSGSITERQLLARIRAFAGSPPRRTLPR